MNNENNMVQKLFSWIPEKVRTALSTILLVILGMMGYENLPDISNIANRVGGETEVAALYSTAQNFECVCCEEITDDCIDCGVGESKYINGIKYDNRGGYIDANYSYSRTGRRFSVSDYQRQQTSRPYSIIAGAGSTMTIGDTTINLDNIPNTENALCSCRKYINSGTIPSGGDSGGGVTPPAPGDTFGEYTYIGEGTFNITLTCTGPACPSPSIVSAVLTDTDGGETVYRFTDSEVNFPSFPFCQGFTLTPSSLVPDNLATVSVECR